MGLGRTGILHPIVVIGRPNLCRVPWWARRPTYAPLNHIGANIVLPSEKLDEYLVKLADEELVNQLRNGGLTDDASKAARNELERRDIDVDRALSQPFVKPDSFESQASYQIQRLRPAIRRAARFPLRTLLGLESPLLVIYVGGGLVYAIYKIISIGVVRIILDRPLHPLATPLAYAGVAIIAFAMAWFGISLWKCSSRIESMPLRMLTKVLASLVAFPTVFGTAGAVRVINQLLDGTFKS